MGLLDALSAGLTAATQGVAANQAGKIQGSQLLRALQMQDLQAQVMKDAHLRNQIENEVLYDYRPDGSPPIPGMGDAQGAPAGPAASPSQAGAPASIPLPLAPQGGAQPPKRGSALPPELIGRTPSALDRPASAPSPAPSGAQGVGGGSDALPSQRVGVPGGTIDPLAAIRRQLMIKRMESSIDADKAVDIANRTGVTDEHRASTKHLANEDDPDFQAKMTYVKALAALPVETAKMVAQGKISLQNGQALENLRSQNETARQHDQQAFQKGQMTREQMFRREQQRQREEAEFVNQSQLTFQRQGDGMWSRIWRPAPSTAAPSSRSNDVLSRYGITPSDTPASVKP